jgi:hypothetical protein
VSPTKNSFEIRLIAPFPPVFRILLHDDVLPAWPDRCASLRGGKRVAE